MEHSLQPGTAAPPSRAEVVLGEGLRPIVFGGASGAFNAFARGGSPSRPALVLGVHSRRRKLLGYLVIDEPASGATWGGMTIAADLGLDDALELARATASQIKLFGIARRTHHCLVTVDENASPNERAAHAEEYLLTLHELVRQGYCRNAFTHRDGRLEPRLAARGLAVSTTTSAIAALVHAGCEPSLSTVAIHEPTALALEVAGEAVQQGLRVTASGDGALTAPADVLLVGSPFWRVSPSEARSIRARVVVSLGPVVIAPEADRRLLERGTVVLPYALSGAGLALVLDLRARGLAERVALARMTTSIEDRARELLAESALTELSLSAIVSSRVG